MAAFVNLTFEGQTEQPLADYFLGPIRSCSHMVSHLDLVDKTINIVLLGILL